VKNAHCTIINAISVLNYITLNDNITLISASVFQNAITSLWETGVLGECIPPPRIYYRKM